MPYAAAARFAPADWLSWVQPPRGVLRMLRLRPPVRHLPLEPNTGTFVDVSTVAEIESAIERLPMEQVREVAAWLEDYQATINASGEVFAMFDAEEGDGDQWHETK